MFLIQHGWGQRPRGQDLLDYALAQGWAQGAILAAGDVVPATLAESAATVLEHNAKLLIDPQLYILSIRDHVTKKLEKYDWFPEGHTLERLSPNEVIRVVESALEFQLDIGASALIAPTPILRDLDGKWASLYHLLASHAEERDSSIPLYLTLVVPEDLLADWEHTRRLLDLVTVFDVHGFYFIVSHRTQYHPLRWDSGTLARAGLVVAELTGEHNEYHVVVGYAGLYGFFLRCLGAESFASGWSNTLQRFHRSRWRGEGFRGEAHARFASPKALGNLFVATHVDDLLKAGDPEGLIAGTMGDQLRVLFPDHFGDWTMGQFRLSHFETCHSLDQLVRDDSLTDRLNNLIDRAQEGIDRFASAKSVAPIEWRIDTGPGHLQAWQAAAEELAQELGASL